MNVELLVKRVRSARTEAECRRLIPHVEKLGQPAFDALAELLNSPDVRVRANVFTSLGAAEALHDPRIWTLVYSQILIDTHPAIQRMLLSVVIINASRKREGAAETLVKFMERGPECAALVSEVAAKMSHEYSQLSLARLMEKRTQERIEHGNN